MLNVLKINIFRRWLLLANSWSSRSHRERFFRTWRSAHLIISVGWTYMVCGNAIVRPQIQRYKDVCRRDIGALELITNRLLSERRPRKMEMRDQVMVELRWRSPTMWCSQIKIKIIFLLSAPPYQSRHREIVSFTIILTLHYIWPSHLSLAPRNFLKISPTSIEYLTLSLRILCIFVTPNDQGNVLISAVFIFFAFI